MEYSNIPQFEEVVKSLSQKKKDILNKAYLYSQNAHSWQKRESWEDYLFHPLAVWMKLWERFHDIDLFVAWLLHDTVKNSESIDISEIYEEFWENVWYMVDWVTKTEKSFYKDDLEYDNERDKMLAWWINNIGCILIRLADREHNLSSLKYVPDEKEITKSFETQWLYLPLMHILWYNEDWLSLKQCRWLFKKYVEENKLNWFQEIKLKLLDSCFENFSEELLGVVYDDGSDVTWELDDRALYKNLIERNFFNSERINLISLKWEEEWIFKLIFKIKVK